MPLPPILAKDGDPAAVLEVLASSTAQKTGREFFSVLAEKLTAVLDVACAVVTESIDVPITRFRTLSAYSKNGPVDNFEMDVDGTPCKLTLGGEITFFGDSVQAHFPKCDVLKVFNAQTYCGVPFFNVHDEVIGHLVIIDDKKWTSNPADGSALKIFAMRAAAELERSRIEARWLLAEKELRNILDTTLDAIIVIENDGRIIEWNPQAEIVFGWQRTDVIGRLVHETVIPPRLAKKHLDGLNRFLETGNSRIVGQRQEVVGVRKDGSEFPAELTISMVSETNFAAFVRDLTPEKEAEHTFRQAQDELAHVSRLCTLGELVTGVAHELNQPLAAISNFSLIAENSDDSAFVSEMVANIGEQAFRAGEIVRRFRNLAAKSEPKRTKCRLDQLISEVVALMRSDLDRHQIELTIDLHPQLGIICVDEIQIQQVILNLLRNSVDALTAQNVDSKKITISAEQKDNQVEVSVVDNGPGVAELNVFDPFVSTKENGMGMGLAISRTIVERHGGRMWLHAEPTATRFHFSIPLSKESDA